MKKHTPCSIGLISLVILVIWISGCASKTPAAKKEEAPMHKLAKMNTPIFWAEGHPGALDRENWKIEVRGLCDKPATFTWDDLQKLPKSTVNGRLTSVTRWSVSGNWGGVKLSDLLAAVQAKDTVKYIRFWSYDLKYDTSIPIDIALRDKTLLAWEFDGEYLTEDYGGPVRAFVPYLWGYKSAKSVIRIDLVDKYIPGFWEKRGYTDRAEIEAGPCRDINDGGTTKQIPDGEVLKFVD